MIQQRWFLTIPPNGAARSVAILASDAFKNVFGAENVRLFDSLSYLNAFDKLLKNPDSSISTDLLNQSIIVSSLDFNTTHFFSAALSPVTSFTLKILKKCGIYTVHWFYENYSRATYWKDVFEYYDLFCAIQKGEIEYSCTGSNTKYCFLPTAHSSSTDFTPDADRPYDIAFIGVPSTYRISVLEMISKAGYSLIIGGSNWNKYNGPLLNKIVKNTWIDNRQSMSILNSSKIGINLSIDAPEGEDVHISPRVYDVLASECILISEDVPLLHDSLPDCHYHKFKHPEELINLIDHILRNYKQEKKLTAENRNLILKNHTYMNRIITLANLVG